MTLAKMALLQLSVLIVLINGCALVQEDLVERNIARVETVPSREFVFESVSVKRKGMDVMITGVLQHRHGRTVRAIPGHIDVLVLDSDGNMVASGTVPYRISHPGSSLWVKFGMYASIDDGTLVRLSHHEKAGDTHDR